MHSKNDATGFRAWGDWDDCRWRRSRGGADGQRRRRRAILEELFRIRQGSHPSRNALSASIHVWRVSGYWSGLGAVS